MSVAHQKPTLVIVTGLPATGKTILAKKLADHFKLPVIHVDQMKETIFDRIGNWEDADLYDKVSKASYDLMYQSAGKILSAGSSCIVDAHLRPDMAESKIAELKEKYGCNLFQIKLKASGQKIVDRYLERHKNAERHECHGNCVPQEEFIKLNGESKTVNIDGETIIIDTTDFSKVNWELIFSKTKENLNWDKTVFMKTLPTKRIAAGILLYNQEGKVLILKPTYKDRWSIPGGVIEAGESLLEGVKREIKEEIGIEADAKRLLVVDSKIVPMAGYTDDSLQIIFEGEVLTDDKIKNIKMATDEISDYKFVEWKEALELLGEHLSNRLKYISKDTKETIILTNGKKI